MTRSCDGLCLADLSVSGLGAGISTEAFQRHGLNTTIVEIDPAVYDAARQYFGLSDPGPGHIFLEDARGWVDSKKREIETKRTDGTLADYDLFDIVVHDCFSGGGVPGHIFTLEFWRDLKSVMSPWGVLAVVRHSLSLFSNLSLQYTLELCRSSGLEVIPCYPNHFTRGVRRVPNFPRLPQRLDNGADGDRVYQHGMNMV